jgi:hypothetical protein
VLNIRVVTIRFTKQSKRVEVSKQEVEVHIGTPSYKEHLVEVFWVSIQRRGRKK